MDFQTVSQDRFVQLAISNILTELGLDDDSIAADSTTIYDQRVTAAKKLSATLRGEEVSNTALSIASPNPDIIKLVERIAETLETNHHSAKMTQEAVRVAIIGHAWLGALTAHGASRLDCITTRDSILEMLRRLAGFGSTFGSRPSPSCDCDDEDCSGGGGCGSCGGGCGQKQP